MKPAIRVENLSKSYRIGARRGADYRTLRETIMTGLGAPWRQIRQGVGGAAGEGSPADEFWALDDVSFEVQPGEVVGIIGRNGAGKSTLLKILSRITEPTGGRAEFRGRIGSLLEVGTGFHPELTGRENIYLNGSILGMSRREVARKFDEIVAFSEIERFLDTPVKRYSSGMYVRLAFAVAAHLEPEILIIDEVLAVGDAEFQKKCLGKMREISERAGRTVMFVSHNMNAVATLCQRAILLRQGRILAQGPVFEVMRAYTDRIVAGPSADLVDHPNRAPSMEKIFRRIEVRDGQGRPANALAPDAPVELRIAVRAENLIRTPKMAVAVTSWRGERVFAVATYLGRTELPPIVGDQVVRVRFKLPPLTSGKYSIDISVKDDAPGFRDEIHGATAFDVAPSNFLETTTQVFDGMGHVMVRSAWEILE